MNRGLVGLTFELRGEDHLPQSQSWVVLLPNTRIHPSWGYVRSPYFAFHFGNQAQITNQPTCFCLASSSILDKHPAVRWEYRKSKSTTLFPHVFKTLDIYLSFDLWAYARYVPSHRRAHTHTYSKFPLYPVMNWWMNLKPESQSTNSASKTVPVP